jgi:hypothetical protein
MSRLIDMLGSILFEEPPRPFHVIMQMFARRRAELVWDYGKSGEKRVMAIPLLYCW